MKRLALIALIAPLAFGVAAAPALAQAKATNAKPAVEKAEPALEITDATPLDVIVQEGLEQDRAKLMLRCAGPPPKPTKQVAATKPASEPAVTSKDG